MERVAEYAALPQEEESGAQLRGGIVRPPQPVRSLAHSMPTHCFPCAVLVRVL